jgi:hypothetical protein
METIKHSDHILKKFGILKSFSIRQVITVEEFMDTVQEFSKTAKDGKEIEKAFQKYVHEKSLQPIPGELSLTNSTPIINSQFNQHVVDLMNFLRKNCKDDEERLDMICAVMQKLGIDI